MDSQPEDSYRYPIDTDAGQPMDDAGEELVEGPDGNFDVVELEVLAQRREWTQAGKKEKPSIMHKICKEFAKMEKHCNLWLVNGEQKEEKITMAQKANQVEEATNNSLLSLQECKEVWSEVHAEFHGGDVAVLQDEDRFLAGWKNEEGIIHRHAAWTSTMILGVVICFDIHTISASWREYLGNAYENPDIAAGEEVQNMAAN
ncbi:hypothetical protein F5141DRAFT_1067904 [Pisolithus sp. B1]|nr:hypothetical protein F5141DRAFT_1067904 [Pisolithus sp. B1]